MNSAHARRVVFDTNTLVSALLLPTSIPRQALDYAFDHGKVLTSLALLSELDRVLNYPKLAPYITPAERSQFLGKLTLEGILTTITVQLTVVRDPKDNFVLKLAVSGGVNMIVSGDNDLITLGSYDGIPNPHASPVLAGTQPAVSHPRHRRLGRVVSEVTALEPV